MSRSTMNVRVAAAREETREERKVRLERAIVKLCQNEDFQIYMAHLLWGVLGLEKDDRGSEVARHRRNTGAAILGELTSVDHLGARFIADAHWDALTAEVEFLKETAKEAKEQSDG